uniref:Transposable element Tcb1 transposase n=1 Tax=Parasteatoda tepidariorum TaxID=114398 RepID=A0A2L2YT05_PARTP
MQKQNDFSYVQKGMIVGFHVKGGSISGKTNFCELFACCQVNVYHAWKNGSIRNQRGDKFGTPRALDDKDEAAEMLLSYAFCQY